MSSIHERSHVRRLRHQVTLIDIPPSQKRLPLTQIGRKDIKRNFTPYHIVALIAIHFLLHDFADPR